MGRGIFDGVSDGQWAVFAEKVVEQRDAARAEVERLTRERDEARAEAAMYKQECASISAEFGLPPTIRPSEGEITRFLEDYRKVRLQAARLRAALEGYHKVAKSIPYAQWTQEQHAADIALNGEKS